MYSLVRWLLSCICDTLTIISVVIISGRKERFTFWLSRIWFSNRSNKEWVWVKSWQEEKWEREREKNGRHFVPSVCLSFFLSCRASVVVAYRRSPPPAHPSPGSLSLFFLSFLILPPAKKPGERERVSTHNIQFATDALLLLLLLLDRRVEREREGRGTQRTDTTLFFCFASIGERRDSNGRPNKSRRRRRGSGSLFNYY